MTDNSNDQTANFFDQVITEYNEGNKRFKTNFINVMKHFYYYNEACFRKGEISVKGKYFIALAISIIKHDEYNIVYYLKKAVENGATEQEIMEIISVCVALDGSSSLSQGVTLILESFDYFHQKAQSQNTNQSQNQSNQDSSAQEANQQNSSNDSKEQNANQQQNSKQDQQKQNSDNQQNSNQNSTDEQNSNNN